MKEILFGNRALLVIAHAQDAFIASRIESIQITNGKRDECQSVGQHLIEDDGRVFANADSRVGCLGQVCTEASRAGFREDTAAESVGHGSVCIFQHKGRASLG